MKNTLLILATVAFLASCSEEKINNYYDLSNLPSDTGGVQTPVLLGATASPYGYYIYTPSGYEATPDAKFPLLVFLHGSGEQGNSQDNPDILNKVLVNGPPNLIKYKKWNPRYPMIVVSPQSHLGNWNGNKLHELIGYLMSKYRINEKRIYMTGLSMGGGGTFTYLTTKGNDGYVAAAVPICGWGGTSDKQVKQCNEIPIWAFHGDADKQVLPSASINFITAYNKQDPAPAHRALLTIYPGVTHNSWGRTYDGSGMGTSRSDYDPFNMSIYDWMFLYEKEPLEEEEGM